jgi:hypothetical protein
MWPYVPVPVDLLDDLDPLRDGIPPGQEGIILEDEIGVPCGIGTRFFDPDLQLSLEARCSDE